MNTHTFQTFHAKTQRRETDVAPRQSLPACPLHRSLSTGPCRLCLARFGFAPLRFCMTVLFLASVLLVTTMAVTGQEVEDTIKIKTRVVFLDALVKDKKTIQGHVNFVLPTRIGEVTVVSGVDDGAVLSAIRSALA